MKPPSRLPHLKEETQAKKVAEEAQKCQADDYRSPDFPHKKKKQFKQLPSHHQ